MNGLNLTITGLNQTALEIGSYLPYAPDEACFDWCSVQHIVNANNVSIEGMMIVAFAYVLLVTKPFFEENETLKDYTYLLDYLARLSLIIFFAYYFLVVRWGII